MAEFCRQCSVQLYGEDLKEFERFTSVDEALKGIAAEMLCEGCGEIHVAPDGSCLSKCTLNHFSGFEEKHRGQLFCSRCGKPYGLGHSDSCPEVTSKEIISPP